MPSRTFTSKRQVGCKPFRFGKEATVVRSIERIESSVRRRLNKRRLPYVVALTDFDISGTRFEVGNLVEQFRVVDHGGESDYTAAMLRDLRPDDVLFDVGANIGLVALHAAKICRTVAFEPDPSFRRRLQVNTALNPERIFTLEPIAISDSDGDVVLYTDGEEGNSPSLVHQRGERGSVSVPARSLDSLLAEGRLPRPTVIKFDIEGAEILALRGAERLLTGSQRPRALFIEVHDTFLPGFGSSAGEVYSLLDEFGYTHAVYRACREDQTHLILHAS
jgi:FkbM family methyltransferase